jgi:hypothetical protein
MISPLCTNELPNPIVTKLRMVVRIHKVIDCAMFGFDQLIGVGTSGSSIMPFLFQRDTVLSTGLALLGRHVKIR